MTAHTHTPGPWYYRPDGIVVEGQNAQGYNYAIAKCGESYLMTDDEARANARLIAAAPDLLAALTALENRLDTFAANADVKRLYTDEIYACAAIARAALTRAGVMP
jgi:hypothetical protein